MNTWSPEYIQIMTLANYELTKGWTFRETNSEDPWLPVARVPTNVHIDLIANEKYDTFYFFRFQLHLGPDTYDLIEYQTLFSASTSSNANGSARSHGHMRQSCLLSQNMKKEVM